MGTVEGDMLLGVRELFNLEDLKFSILLGEREDPGVIEVELLPDAGHVIVNCIMVSVTV
jgi:hypothetical protein